MRSLTPETRVGILTLAAGIALLYISMKTAGVSFLGDRDFMTFYMKFGTVAGVETRSKVKLSGVEIGYVEDILLEDSYATIKAKLTRKANIRSDSMATIRTSGLLGEKYIEIVQGSPGQPFITDGATLANTQDPADISDMINKMGGALDDVKAVTGSLKNVFGALEGEMSLKKIMDSVHSASENLNGMISENRADLKTTLESFAKVSSAFAKNAPTLVTNLEKVAAGLQEILAENKEDLTAGISGLKNLSTELREVIGENRENLRETLDNLAGATGKIDEVMESIKKTSGSMETVTARIERGEGTIGKLVTEEEVYDRLNETLSGAGKFLNKAEDLTVYLGMRGEWGFDVDEGKAFFSVALAPREDKFYLLEVSEDTRREDLSTTRNTLNSLLYTIMVAKRFSDLTLRGGLIESSAGMGFDYYMSGGRFVATAELFNLGGYDDDAENPQFKAWVRWNAHKYFYFYLGGDELFNDHYRSLFVGSGILFDENDLKMALGVL